MKKVIILITPIAQSIQATIFITLLYLQPRAVSNENFRITSKRKLILKCAVMFSLYDFSSGTNKNCVILNVRRSLN